jgi:hypothetical protein
MDIVVNQLFNKLQNVKPKFRLTYPKSLTSRQKRSIRNAFNQIQPEFTKLVEEEMVCAIAFGNPLYQEVKNARKV